MDKLPVECNQLEPCTKENCKQWREQLAYFYPAFTLYRQRIKTVETKTYKIGEQLRISECS